MNLNNKLILDSGDYSFNKTNKTITFNDNLGVVDLTQILLIVNATAGILIYDFSNVNLKGSILINVLTLVYDTTNMSNTDELLIVLDTKNIGKTIDLIATQEVTAAYVNFGTPIKTYGRDIELLLNADCNDSEDVDLKYVALDSVGGTEYDINGVSAIALWTGSGTDFNKTYKLTTNNARFVQLKAKAGTLGVTPAYMTGGSSALGQLPTNLTGGTSATTFGATWTTVTDGEFAITIDGTAYDILGIDFSGAGDIDSVATLIQDAIRAATGGTETVVWSTDHFIITSAISITVASAVSGGAGTDISGVGATPFMDCETGVGTAVNGWSAITDGEFKITIDGVEYDISGLDFSSALDMNGVADVIERALQTASSTLVTCVWSTDHFVITSVTYNSTSEVSVTNIVTTPAGTDISGAGASDYMDSDSGNGTATAVVGTAVANLTIKYNRK